MTPLPEGTFFYRRIFTYGVAVALLALIGFGVWNMDSDAELKSVIFWLIILLWWNNTYYLVAPTAEQIVRIIQSARVMMNKQDNEDSGQAG